MEFLSFCRILVNRHREYHHYSRTTFSTDTFFAKGSQTWSAFCHRCGVKTEVQIQKKKSYFSWVEIDRYFEKENRKQKKSIRKKSVLWSIKSRVQDLFCPTIFFSRKYESLKRILPCTFVLVYKYSNNAKNDSR